MTVVTVVCCVAHAATNGSTSFSGTTYYCFASCRRASPIFIEHKKATTVAVPVLISLLPNVASVARLKSIHALRRDCTTHPNIKHNNMSSASRASLPMHSMGQRSRQIIQRGTLTKRTYCQSTSLDPSFTQWKIFLQKHTTWRCHAYPCDSSFWQARVCSMRKRGRGPYLSTCSCRNRAHMQCGNRKWRNLRLLQA